MSDALNQNDSHLREERHRRIRRLKKWMRRLPRRSNVHRYPVLKWFAGTARKRIYLWSFRSREMVPALYVGFVISLMPFVGAQILIAFLLALIVRANLPVMVGLQMISNPLTMGPIYYADYKIGMALLELVHLAPSSSPLPQSDDDWSHFRLNDVRNLTDAFPPMLLGGVVFGSFVGLVAAVAYKWLAKRAKVPHLREVDAMNGESDKEGERM